MLYIIERKKAKENIVKYDPLDLFYLLVYKLSTNNFTVRKMLKFKGRPWKHVLPLQTFAKKSFFRHWIVSSRFSGTGSCA